MNYCSIIQFLCSAQKITLSSNLEPEYMECEIFSGLRLLDKFSGTLIHKLNIVSLQQSKLSSVKENRMS